MNSVQKKDRGFTLIEVLVVLMIIAVIVAFTIPAMGPALKGSKLRQAADELESLLSGSHQLSITENTPVEIRFFKYEDPESPGSTKMFRSYQSAQVISNPQDHKKNSYAVGEVKMLPAAFVIAEKTYSSLVESEFLRRDEMEIPRSKSAEYVAFEFRPDGSTNLANVDEKHWALTIMRETDLGSSLDEATEFITLVLNPFNGRIRRLRPE
ncbi:MAG: Verru_Chthon cassette protein D [Verrucomicrobiota bacterium]|jgi:uncharacterized protein (TIGR02596 family)|nr:Verru_Chthon cassette protein D [Verrucomicrobiota bacterium]MEC8906770.1 Verru_Chthon cassette protein D [Verrucomicrobiota bacterium]MED6298550.1 Verru_Chthon cassette protein D [Verrucomicrobiota bacterium]MEE3176361.1 Verru_Chthon cassette protein D [Verrucomicrobiota bacterium]NRB43531.1 Verru_Chthon cassette protein D [Verrucomicrobiales bacterium]